MEIKDLEFHDSITRQLRTIEHLTIKLMKSVEQHQQGTESSQQQPLTDDVDDEFDGFDFGAPIPQISERLCRKCLEELSIYGINTPYKKLNFICERCVEKRAVAQANHVNTVYGHDNVKTEPLQNIVNEKRKYKSSIKIVFWIIVAACVSLIFI